ncbi:hypothetical protein EG68_12087 [Paragonimus skrjabini miyazakii]|uniref:Uncharacterized protein n=1 Tax=Paragonimus skrjabini miyazakii TaxID=59628 RepID=A0A8S9YGV2_9TREM|nr:hypothetical protein EG68_12087 [Paragonimus skrjabini miyazakii]
MPARKRTARGPQLNSSESCRLPHPQCSHQVTDFSEGVIIPTIIPSNSAPISVSPAVFRSRPVLPPAYNGSSTALDIDDDKTERLPTFSCNRLTNQFESGMIRLSNCCTATCNRVCCCRLRRVYSRHANSSDDSCSPLLSVPPTDRGSSVDVCAGNDTLETTVEQTELDRLNTEVVEWHEDATNGRGRSWKVPAITQTANRFPPDDDFESWEFAVTIYLANVPERSMEPYILSFLSEEAARMFRTTGVRPIAPASVIWEALRQLFEKLELPAVYGERFFNRHQRPGESVDSFLRGLQELALKTFKQLTPVECERNICERFCMGLRNRGLRNKFILRPAENLSVALI